MEVDCYKFLSLVESQILEESAIKLLTVSDGSDDSGAMTFGWIIAMPCGLWLAQCSGPAYGPTGSSFRAEGYDFLSVSPLLVQLCEFCLITPSWSIQMMMDNQGLLTCIEICLPHSEAIHGHNLVSQQQARKRRL
jgi:hypothetical protein